MAKLILLRHYKSQWNQENRFTGWVDVPLLKQRSRQDIETSKKVAESGFDAVYTSPLIRNLATVLEVFQYSSRYPIFRHFKGKMKKQGNFHELNRQYIPVYVSEALNERYYGKLQGLNKEEIMRKYGKGRVHRWRRSFDRRPPGGETLREVCSRVVPFFRKYIEKDLKRGKGILVVASHNSARAIIKHIERISDRKIISVEMPFGGLLEYEFSAGLYKRIN